MRRSLTLVIVTLALGVTLSGQSQPSLYIEPANEGFEVYLSAAMAKKKVPVTVMAKAEGTAFTLRTAAIDEETVSTGKRFVNCVFASCAGNENKAATSVQLINAQGEIVWSYAVNKGRGAKNKQSMAESIAKHLKDDYLKKKR